MLATQVAPKPQVNDVELVQEAEVTTEQTWQGWDAANLETVVEAAGPLTYGQMEGLKWPTVLSECALPGWWDKCSTTCGCGKPVQGCNQLGAPSRGQPSAYGQG